MVVPSGTSGAKTGPSRYRRRKTSSARDWSADPAYRHHGRVAVIAPLALTAGLLVNGFDNAFGHSATFVINALLMIYLLVIAPPPLTFWAAISPVIAIMLTAIIWLSLPLAGVARQWGIVPLTPDIAVPQFLGLAASLTALTAGCLVGFRHIRRTVVDWLLLFASVDMIIGLLAWQGDWTSFGDIWGSGREGRFAGTLGNANVAGALFGAFAVLALSRALGSVEGHDAKRPARRYRIYQAFRWLALLLSLGACAATASRAAMLLTLCGMLVVGARLLRKRRDRGALLFAAGALAIIAVVLFAGYSDRLLQRSQEISVGSSERWLMWTHCMGLVKDSPLFGYGLGSFPMLNARSLDDPQLAGALWSSNSPHNVLLRLTLEGGCLTPS